MINFDSEQVWRQIGQASDNGEWYDFDEVELVNNELEAYAKQEIEQSRGLLEKIKRRNYWINKELKFEIEKQLKSK
jgi:hypothetical protein